MSLRLRRVKELLKRELGDQIGRMLVFEQLVTVQEVDITPDLRQAHVFISVLGGTEAQARSIISQIQNHRKELQAAVSKRVILKYTPHLHFQLDKAVERGTRVIDILQTLDIPDDPAPSEDEDAGDDGIDGDDASTTQQP